jgi:hypothetical protein
MRNPLFFYFIAGCCDFYEIPYPLDRGIKATIKILPSFSEKGKGRFCTHMDLCSGSGWSNRLAGLWYQSQPTDHSTGS